MLGLGSIGYVQSFQYVLINIEPVRPSDYSQFVFLALCVFDFDIPGLDCACLHSQGMVEKAFGRPGLITITTAQFVYPLAGTRMLLYSSLSSTLIYYGNALTEVMSRGQK